MIEWIIGIGIVIIGLVLCWFFYKEQFKKVLGVAGAGVGATLLIMSGGLIDAQAGEAWIIDGNSVYINTSKAFISVTPHTLTDDNDVTLEVLSKNFTGDITVAFEFDNDIMSPSNARVWNISSENVPMQRTCDTTNGTYFYNASGGIAYCWTTENTTLVWSQAYDSFNASNDTIYWSEEVDTSSFVASGATPDNIVVDGTKIYYFANVAVEAGVPRKFKFHLNIAGGEGKYNVSFWPSSYGGDITQAELDGNYYVLDPWWNTTQGLSTKTGLYNGSVAYYSFDNDDLSGSNALDLSGNGRTVVNTGITTGVPGLLNEAFYFAAGGDVGTVTAFNPTGDSGGQLSVSLWTNSSAPANHNFVSQWNSGSSARGWQLMAETSTGYVKWWACQTGTCGTGNIYVRTPSGVLNGSNHHIVATWDNGVMRVYVDGVKQTLTAINNVTFTKIGTLTANVLIGEGQIAMTDEVGIWNRTLSDAEVLRLYNDGTPLSHDDFGDLDEFRYAINITINSSEVDSDLTDFPVYVNMSAVNFNRSNFNESDCGDLRVTNSTGGELPREIVSCNPTGYFETAETGTASGNGWYSYSGTCTIAYDATVAKGGSYSVKTTAGASAHCAKPVDDLTGKTVEGWFYDAGDTYNYPFLIGDGSSIHTMACFRNTGFNSSYYGCTFGATNTYHTSVAFDGGWHHVSYYIADDDSYGVIYFDGVEIANLTQSQASMVNHIESYVVTSADENYADNIRIHDGFVQGNTTPMPLTGELHFKADYINSSADTNFTIYYGSPTATDYAVTDTYGANAVWSDYVAVWHLEDLNDSTDGNHDLTNSGAVQVSDRLGKAYDFELGDSTDVLSTSDNSEFTFSAGGGNDNPYTMYAWVKLESLTANMIPWAKFLAGGGNTEYQPLIRSTGQVMIANDDGPGNDQIGRETNTGAMASGGLYHLAYTYNGNNAVTGFDIIIDGVVSDTTDWTFGAAYDGMTDTTQPFRIGNRDPSVAPVPFDGVIDEVRVSGTNFTTQYVAATYKNQKSGSTFLSSGSEVDLTDAPAGSNIGIYNITSPTNTTYTTATINLNWTANLTPDYCAYVLNGGAANTSICDPSVTNVSFTVADGSHNVYITGNFTENGTLVNSSTVYFTVNTEVITIAFCSGISGVYFLGDVRNYNFTTNTITDYNISALNQSTCLFNVTSTSSNQYNYTAQTNTTTTAKQRVYCGQSLATKIELNTTPVRILTNTVNGTLSCWSDWIGVGAGDYKEINISVSQE